MRLTNPNAFGPDHNAESNYELLKELGDCYAAVDNYPRALECYRQAVDAAPRQAGPYVGLGVIGLQTDQIEDAEKAFAMAITLQPQCHEAFGGMAMIYQRKQQYAHAFDMYLKCLEIDSDNLVALLGLFQTSVQMGEFSKVIYYLEVFLESHPDDVSVLFCVATLYARDGRLEEARDTLIKVLVLEPGKKEAADLLAQVHGSIAKARSETL